MFYSLRRAASTEVGNYAYAIQNTETTSGFPDVEVFTSEVERDARLYDLAVGASWAGNYFSADRGGHWEIPWERTYPEPEVTSEPEATTDSIISAEFPGSRSDQAQAKLRELVHERNQLRRDLVNARTEMAAEHDRLVRRISAAEADISDVNDTRLQPIWDKAAEAAEEAGFCSEYDRLCSTLGIPGRERTWRGVATVTIDAYVYVTARSDEEAMAAIEERMQQEVNERIGQGYFQGPGSVTNVDVQQLEVDDVEIY